MRGRFDEMVSDIDSLVGDPCAWVDTTAESCGWAGCGERQFTTSIPHGELRLLLRSKRIGAQTYKYITLTAGNV